MPRPCIYETSAYGATTNTDPEDHTVPNNLGDVIFSILHCGKAKNRPSPFPGPKKMPFYQWNSVGIRLGGNTWPAGEAHDGRKIHGAVNYF